MLDSLRVNVTRGLQDPGTLNTLRETAIRAKLGIFQDEVEHGDVKKTAQGCSHLGAHRSVEVLSTDSVLRIVVGLNCRIGCG